MASVLQALLVAQVAAPEPCSWSLQAVAAAGTGHVMSSRPAGHGSGALDALAALNTVCLAAVVVALAVDVWDMAGKAASAA